MLVLLLVAVAAAAVGGFLFWRWHRAQQAEFAAQHRSVEAFVGSPAFEAFARDADAQFVATRNFVLLRPATVSALLPEIAAAEKERHQTPWAVELAPLSISTAEHPALVRKAILAATDLLAARGFNFDQDHITAARRIFLRLLTPHARTFFAVNTSDAFPAILIDRRMQAIVLTAYAERAGGTLAETDRAFVFYSLIGPSLWREIEAQTTPDKPSPGQGSDEVDIGWSGGR